MELTKEQQDIINSSGNIKINAVAGSGKTTTVIEYAKTRPSTSKILYLAFNKSVKLEAVKKFQEKGLDNVKVETAHSLAFRHIVTRSKYSVRTQNYKSSDVVEILNLQGSDEKHTEFIMASHINRFVAYFCNSDKSKVQDLNYLDTVTDSMAKDFATKYYNHILKQTRIFLGKMDSGEIEITHDFYLKKFQLSNPTLNYDYILFDEGQDASPAMLDVFFKQNATKVIVGDTHQQIYGWRFAVNSLEKADFKTYHLSTSFRFCQDIADLAMGILKFKKHIGDYQNIPISGKGNNKTIQSKAILARTNLGLLLRAIEYITDNKNVTNIYFEGNINSYTYADEGASLYDVLHLYNGKHSSVKDKLIKSMKTMEDLEDYIDKTEDMQLGMMVEIVKEYGNKIPSIIKSLKDKHVENEAKESAEMIFSTVHRCKGMEYDVVELVNDFMTEEKLEKLKTEKKAEDLNIAKLNEEVNLLYVATTRTKHSLYIPFELMPKDFPVSPQIYVVKALSKEEKQKAKYESQRSNQPEKQVKEKTYKVEEVREKHKDAYKPWTDELDNELRTMFLDGTNLKELATHFDRTRSAITSRLVKLNLSEVF